MIKMKLKSHITRLAFAGTSASGLLAAAVVVAILPLAAAAQVPKVPGFDGTTITVGSIQPLTGGVAVLGIPIEAGLQTWFDHVNALGGIAGKYKIKVALEDAQNTESLTVQKYGEIKDRVVMMASISGTSPVKAVLPDLQRDQMIASPTSFEDLWIHEKNLLPIGSTYALMAINAVDHYLRKVKPAGKVCGLVRDDGYGEAGWRGALHAIKYSRKEPGPVLYFAAPDQDFTGQINQLKAGGCDAVFVTTVPGQLVRIVGTAARVGFAPQWIGQWASWHGALLTSPVLDYLEKNFLLAGDGLEWASAAAPGMVTMLADLNRYSPKQKPDVWYTAGYVQGKAVTALLEKAVANKDLSRAGLMRALTEMSPVDNQGLIGNYKYGPISTREAPRSGSVFKINRNKPFGLQAVETNFTSEAARNYMMKQ
jgi:ABC-type branched-subunit amino acid transport system substrate-binding protein